jgi:hypothetical protein
MAYRRPRRLGVWRTIWQWLWAEATPENAMSATWLRDQWRR